MNSSKLSLFCDRFLEAGWLIGITVTPVFFNVYSSRVFEPDKLTTLRSLASIMAVLWLIRLVEEILHGERPLRFSWRTPLVLPALATMVVYLISSIFSLVPYTSFVGSYQRLQGTYTLFGYLVIFFAILTSLRTRAQLSRLVTVLIINSLPVALYGALQHGGRDPLPWAGNVQRRVASNMGNAIFVAAYLIMITPLTAARIVKSFQDILEREEARITDILRASGYIFILAVQLLTIWWARSRGPWLGAIAGLFLFPYLLLILLQRRALAEDEEEGPGGVRDVPRAVGLGLGVLIVTGLLVVMGAVLLPGQLGLYVGGGLALITFGGVWLYFIIERIGWRWLWISWATVGFAVALGLLSINLPGPLQSRVREVESLRRMTTILEWESGTGRVRTLIWEGALELILPHEPLPYPDGSADPFNAIRPLVGYGPEAMYVGYNNFYPPLLGHYESRNASPDRSHNETLDSVVITGVLGLAVYVLTFVSVFYWVLRWLGFIHDRRDLWTYLGLMTVITVGLFIFFALQGRPYFFAVAIPLGILLGLGIYLTWQAFRGTLRGSPRDVQGAIFHPHSLLLVAILAAMLAHFVEINFGIAIAATRTTFWTLAGLLVVLGLQWVPSGGDIIAEVPSPAENKRSKSRSRRRPGSVDRSQEAWATGVVAVSLLAAFLLGTLAFNFITNPDRSTDVLGIFWQSLTLIHSSGMRSPGTLMMFFFTWLLFGIVGLGELDSRNVLGEHRRSRLWGAIFIYAGFSLFIFLFFALLQAAFHARLPQIQVSTVEGVVTVAVLLAGILGRYYAFLFLLAIAIALVLMAEERSPKNWAHWASLLALPFLLIFASFVIRNYSYNLIRADIVFKQGDGFAQSRSLNEKQIAIAHFDKSIELAPREDYYRLFLGKAYLETAQTLPPDTPQPQVESIFGITEEVLQEAREIAPLNTDHSANLARFYNIRASQPGMRERRDEFVNRSIENYRKALTLSPNNVILWNELARAYYVAGNKQAYQETLEHSLALDPEYEQTWVLIGEVRYSEGDAEGAIEAYEEAVALLPRDCNFRYSLGSLQIQQGLWEEAETSLTPILERCPRMNQVWDVYRLLSVSAFYQEEYDEALNLAMESLQRVPEGQRNIVEELIAAIQQQQQPAPADAPAP
ncbi:MAG: tetratricopeptide repeat protein [Anaerolineales bacterium]